MGLWSNISPFQTINDLAHCKKRERFLIKIVINCRIITTFATDINLMRIKLTGIKHEILRQKKGVGHTPDKLGADIGARTHDSSNRAKAHW
jgi:hypothetical protein